MKTKMTEDQEYWFKKGIEHEQDRLVSELLKRGGFATLQLQPPCKLPRLRFVEPEQVNECKVAKVAGRIIAKS